MTLIALGINHNTASVELREKLAFSPTDVDQALTHARESKVVDELAILSTCNRTELYCRTSMDADQVLAWLADIKGVGLDSLVDVHYCHKNMDAARHMMSVASGLDSLVLGEPQILGQMKSSYAVAREGGALSTGLYDVFHQVFSVAKRVRSETAIGENPVSVAYAAVSLAQQIFSDLKDDTALLIGAGETIELVARHLCENGIKQMIVANRTLENATKLASKFGAQAVLLSDIPECLSQADIVISSTASQLPLLGKGAVEHALKIRKHKPMFMVDIAVPRDIEPQVGDLNDVFLYAVDDLKEVIDENMRSRQKAAEIARDIIDEGVKKFEREQRALSSVDTIKTFRQHVTKMSAVEVEKALKQLDSGTPAEEVITYLARNLSNKFMHEPTLQMKKSSADGRQDLIKSLKQLFGFTTED